MCDEDQMNHTTSAVFTRTEHHPFCYVLISASSKMTTKSHVS